MELTNYSVIKASGQLALAKLNDAYVLSTKKFDSATGQPTSPEVQAVDMKQVEEQIASLQVQMDSLNALLADLKALG